MERVGDYSAYLRDPTARLINSGPVARRKQRYPSDISDEQWELIEPLLPEVKTAGRREKHPRRAAVDAILYAVRTGCAWRALPADFPPWQTVYWYFNQWEQARVTEKVLPVVRGQLRVQEGRDLEPSAGLIDSQSVRGADTVGQDSRGFAVIPRRWAVERTFGWLTARRRLARDYECHPAHSETMIRWAAINIITRRIARGGRRNRQPSASSHPRRDLLKHALSLIFNLESPGVAPGDPG